MLINKIKLADYFKKQFICKREENGQKYLDG